LPRQPHSSLKLAIALTALTAGLLAITVYAIVASLRQHGHAHMNLMLLLLDGMMGIVTAVEWCEWFRHR
jgi:NADH:ubiquinone oxidoreductase subunit 4 (subunit M)